MEVIQADIFLIISLFPNEKDLILKLMLEDAKFRDICEDYKICFLTLKRLDQSTSVEKTKHRQEYQILLKELEHEIKQYLFEANSPFQL